MNRPQECAAVRAQLDAYLSGELPPQNAADVKRHLESCRECAAELAARDSMRAQLQSAVRATPVPAGLEAKVRQALRSPNRARAGRPRTGWWAVLAAASVILCVFLVNQLRVSMNPEQAILSKTSGPLAAIFKIGLQDHLQCAVFRKYAKQPVPANQMAADLGPQFAGLAPLVEAKLPGDFRLIQAHHCTAGGRAYTHFIMAGDGKLVSLILTRKQAGESLAGGIYQQGVARFQVVGFESQGYLVYVISDMNAQQNLQWAAKLAPTLRQFLADRAA